MSMVRHDMQCYVLADRFFHQNSHFISTHQSSVHARLVTVSDKNKPDRKTRKYIIDKAHRHLCGYSSYYDIKTLFKRNKVWKDDCSHYVRDLHETCVSCHVTYLPTKRRAVALNSFSPGSNELCFVDFSTLTIYSCSTVWTLWSVFTRCWSEHTYHYRCNDSIWTKLDKPLLGFRM